NVARYTPPVLPRDPGMLDEWEVLARLTRVVAAAAGAAAGGPDGSGGPGSDDPAVIDDTLVRAMAAAAVADPASAVHGRPAGDVIDALGPRRGPERLLDLLLRTGPYGDAFGAGPGLSLDALLAA